MASPAQRYQRTPDPGNPARTEAWALLEAARQLSHAKHGRADGVFTLQELPDALAERKRAIARADRLLAQLDALRLGLLAGTLPHAQLSELAGLAASQRGKIEDPRLAAIFDEIDLRARVELAKLAAAP